MTTPHKWAEVIKAWADGKPIQWADSDGIWNDYSGGQIVPNFNIVRFCWRVKPNIIKYRRYLLTTSSNSVLVGLANDTANFDSLGVEHTWGPQFVRWIDTEWQEVEYD